MRVLLLNPSTRGTFRLVGFLFPPIGLLYVAAATRARGHKVDVVDRSVDRRKIDLSSFDVVGIHSDTTRVNRGLELAQEAKAAGARVVFGGPHPCFMAEEILATGVVDAIVRGEGESTFPDLLDAWENGSDPTSISVNANAEIAPSRKRGKKRCFAHRSRTFSTAVAPQSTGERTATPPSTRSRRRHA